MVLQGLVTLKDATASTGGLVVIPQSHMHHSDLCERLRHPVDFVPVPPGDPVLAAPKRLVTARAGDLVLWDSRTVHCNEPGPPSRVQAASGDDVLRAVSYVCMTPVSKAPYAVISRRQEAFESNVSSTHWPHDFQPSCGPSTTSASLVGATALQRSLVGEHRGSPQRPSDEAMAAMEEANRLEAEGDFAGAKRAINEAIRLGHDCLAVHGGWK